MSTKIYNAYKYNGNLSSLISFLKEIRSKYHEEKINMFSGLGHIKITEKYVPELKKILPELEKNEITLKELSDELMGDMVFSSFLEKQMKLGYNTPVNIQASAVVFAHNNDIYVKFFGIKNDYYKNNNKLIDFHYQNSTDISNYDWDKEKWEEMSEERQKELEDDWNNREKIWDEIITDYGTFGESGLTFDFHPNDYKMLTFIREIFKNLK